MPIRIEMPRLSDTMEEGTLVKWKVAQGDKVSAGDTLADVETDKATMELQAFDDGVVAKRCLEEGDTASVGRVILILAEKGESVEEAARAAEGDTQSDGEQKGQQKKDDTSKPKENKAQQDEPPARQASLEDDQADDAPVDEKKPSSSAAARVSPLAAKMAEEAGVDLSKIQGSGPGGRIIKRDIEKASEGGSSGGERDQAAKVPGTAPAPAPAQLKGGRTSVSNMRKTIARRLVESKTTVPHFQVSTSVNVDPLQILRKTVNDQLASQGVKLSINDYVIRAVAIACIQHPLVNSAWREDAIETFDSVNVGVAISLPPERGGGLVVATVADVQDKGLRTISEEVKTLANQARERGLTPQQMGGSTITISNLGAPQYGKVTQFTAIINPPNAAIIAVGAAIKQPVVRDGQLAVGTEMSLTLSGDHRIIDGAVAAEYLHTLTGLPENPASLLV